MISLFFSDCLSSACVLNLISFDAAYSLYPRATFHERVSLITKKKTYPLSPVMLKWAERGWKPFKSYLPEGMSQERYDLSFPSHSRWIDDGHSWTIRLDQTGLTPPPPLSRLSPQLTRDPVACTNWALVRPGPSGFYPTVYYKLAQATWLRHRYALCDDALIEELTAGAWRRTAAENAKESYAAALAAIEGRGERGARELLSELRVWSDADFPHLCASYRAKGLTQPPAQSEEHLPVRREQVWLDSIVPKSAF